MNTGTRKQREIAERHRLFLDLGREMIIDDGFGNFGMDRLAERAEYSKGTVYQHFNCKEELLIQLCIRNHRQLESLFARARNLSGNPREKLLAIFLAHNLWTALDPAVMHMYQAFCGGEFKDKVTPASLEDHDALERNIIGIVASIVIAAVDAGDLTLPAEMNPNELVFGLWATCHGGQILQTMDLPLQEFGIRHPASVLLQISQATLDGMNWRPLSSDFDYNKTMQSLIANEFAEECRQIELSPTPTHGLPLESDDGSESDGPAV